MCALTVCSLHLLLVQDVVRAVAALGGGAVGVGAVVSEDAALAAAGGEEEHGAEGQQKCCEQRSAVGRALRVQRGRRKGLCTQASALLYRGICEGKPFACPCFARKICRLRKFGAKMRANISYSMSAAARWRRPPSSLAAALLRVLSQSQTQFRIISCLANAVDL